MERKPYRRPTEFQRAWWRVVDGGRDVWAQFTSMSSREKGMVIGTGMLVAVLAPLVVFGLMEGGGGAAAPVETGTPVGIISDSGPAPTTIPSPTSTPKAVPPTQTPKPPNRENCAEIRGTAYRSEAERDWFVSNCGDEPEPVDTATPVPPAVQQPTDTPQPEPSISASQAKTMAASWISSNIAFGELTVSAAGCSALPSGNGWRVGCTGTTPGCQAATCDRLILVCVSNNGSARQC